MAGRRGTTGLKPAAAARSSAAVAARPAVGRAISADDACTRRRQTTAVAKANQKVVFLAPQRARPENTTTYLIHTSKITCSACVGRTITTIADFYRSFDHRQPNPHENALPGNLSTPTETSASTARRVGGAFGLVVDGALQSSEFCRRPRAKSLQQRKQTRKGHAERCSTARIQQLHQVKARRLVQRELVQTRSPWSTR